LNCRSETESVLRLGLRRDRWLLLGIAVGILLQVGVLYTAVGNTVLRTLPIHPAMLGQIVLVASAVLWAEELRQVFTRRSHRRRLASPHQARPLGAAQEGSGPMCTPSSSRPSPRLPLRPRRSVPPAKSWRRPSARPNVCCSCVASTTASSSDRNPAP